MSFKISKKIIWQTFAQYANVSMTNTVYTPSKICVYFIFIFHPWVLVHKKLGDGQKCHEDEYNQWHWEENQKS